MGLFDRTARGAAHAAASLPEPTAEAVRDVLPPNDSETAGSDLATLSGELQNRGMAHDVQKIRPLLHELCDQELAERRWVERGDSATYVWCRTDAPAEAAPPPARQDEANPKPAHVVQGRMRSFGFR